MSEVTTRPAARATKAPRRAQSAPAPEAKLQSPATPAPQEFQPTADEQLVAATLRQQVIDITDQFLDLYGESSELLHAAAEALDKLQGGGYVALYRAAALVAGAIAIERADRPSSSAIALMEAVRHPLEAASLAYDVTLEPGELMATGIRAGQRQFRDRPTPPIRRIEEESGITGRSALTREQLLCVLEVAANNLSTINTILMLAQEEPESFAVAGLVDAAQALTRHCGGMVDTAAGEAILGGHDHWNFGPNFAALGKAGAA